MISPSTLWFSSLARSKNLFIFLFYFIIALWFPRTVKSTWCQVLLFLISKNKDSDLSRVWPEGFVFNSYHTELLWRVLFHFLECSILPLILTLYNWVLSKVASSTIFLDFSMTRCWIEPRFPGPLVNTVLTRLMARNQHKMIVSFEGLGTNAYNCYVMSWWIHSVTETII